MSKIHQTNHYQLHLLKAYAQFDNRRRVETGRRTVLSQVY